MQRVIRGVCALKVCAFDARVADGLAARGADCNGLDIGNLFPAYSENRMLAAKTGANLPVALGAIGVCPIFCGK